MFIISNYGILIFQFSVLIKMCKKYLGVVQNVSKDLLTQRNFSAKIVVCFTLVIIVPQYYFCHSIIFIDIPLVESESEAQQY